MYHDSCRSFPCLRRLLHLDKFLAALFLEPRKSHKASLYSKLLVNKDTFFCLHTHRPCRSKFPLRKFWLLLLLFFSTRRLVHLVWKLAHDSEFSLNKGRPFDFWGVEAGGGGGGGDMGDLVWVRFFFPQTSGDRIFCMTFLCLFCLFVCFFEHYTPFFFSVQEFLSSKSVCRISFLSWNHPYPYPNQKFNARPLRRL